jgi:hypothetical protein
MKKAPSHVLHETTYGVYEGTDYRSSRLYFGEEQGGRVVRWLNSQHESKAGLRVARILLLLGQIREEHPTTPAESKTLIPELQSLLRNWRVWASLNGPYLDPKQPLLFHWKSNKPEGDLLLHLVRLSETNLLDRVRRCSKCRIWFFARFRHQRYCTTRCQQSAYKTSEEWKDRRRKYMREYRRTQL